MPSMKAIKRRITSVKNTQQIMKAMNLVAASKVQRNKVKMEAIRPMFDGAREFMENGADHQDALDSPYYAARQVENIAYIVITGERGLCGSYNANILKEALSKIEAGDKGEQIIAVGAKCKEYFIRRGRQVAEEYKGVLESVSYSEAAMIATHAVDMYVEGKVDEVWIAYTQFETLLSHKPTLIKLLPLEPKKQDTHREVIYEPDVFAYLRKAVPVYMTMFIYGAMTEASVCEQASRMTSMDAAARNASEIVDDLTLQYNRQRQGAITQEISEIVGGANVI